MSAENKVFANITGEKNKTIIIIKGHLEKNATSINFNRYWNVEWQCW